jgi:hypothetical protein
MSRSKAETVGLRRAVGASRRGRGGDLGGGGAGDVLLNRGRGHRRLAVVGGSRGSGRRAELRDDVGS